MGQSIFAIIVLSIFTSCQCRQQVTLPISTIDSTLQVNATAILESKLSEINAQSGQVIIMEVQSGQIKALVGLTKKDSTNYQSCENFSVWQSTGLMHPISLLAALPTHRTGCCSAQRRHSHRQAVRPRPGSLKWRSVFLFHIHSKDLRCPCRTTS